MVNQHVGVMGFADGVHLQIHPQDCAHDEGEEFVVGKLGVKLVLGVKLGVTWRKTSQLGVKLGNLA